MGDVIYDKTCENNALREQIVNVDESHVKSKMQESREKSTGQRHKVIYSELAKHMQIQSSVAKS